MPVEKNGVYDELGKGTKTLQEHNIGAVKATPPVKNPPSSKEVSSGFKMSDASFNQPSRPARNVDFKPSSWKKGKPGA